MSLRSLVMAMGMVLAVSTATQAENVADLYKSKCKNCHALDGSGNTTMGKKHKVKPFSDPATKAMSDDELIKITSNGKGKMPKYSDRLTADQIKELVGYVRTL